MKRLHAIVLLGWHFLLHYLSKITFLYDPGGLEQFRENFDDDGLRSLDEESRRKLADWQKCIGCGYCEAACPELKAIPENRHRGPALMAESSIRDLSETELAAVDADAIESCDFERLERVCPTDVPIRDIAEFLAETDRPRSLPEGAEDPQTDVER